jgi:hypothetical protein
VNEYLVIAWADSVPVEDGLADAARDRGGQLLAAGPVLDASELDSRPAPAGLVIARFGTEETARSWFDAVLGGLDGTTLLVAGATAPVWWPPEKEPERPGCHGEENCRPGRLGLFVNVWVEITDTGQFFDYSVHYRWTVEHDGGLVLVPGPEPFQHLLRGGPAPHTRWP